MPARVSQRSFAALRILVVLTSRRLASAHVTPRLSSPGDREADLRLTLAVVRASGQSDGMRPLRQFHLDEIALPECAVERRGPSEGLQFRALLLAKVALPLQEHLGAGGQRTPIMGL